MSHWVKSLLTWYDTNQRQLPWRTNPSPYKTWISEMMLQQTQVATVIDYFNRFLTQFPTVNDLANANEQTVLKCWEGLGYYSRARNLHKAAKLIVTQHQSQLPQHYEELQTLPGIGPYCGAAITSIAFGHPVPVVDGNVLRVFTRFWGIFDDIAQPKVKTMLFHKLEHYIDGTNPADFNQAIMELGALICIPKAPKCMLCPIRSNCFAHNHGKTTELPYKTKKAPTPHYTIAVGVIWKDKTLLIGKRKTNQMLGGLWEFPGGKQLPKETLKQTIKREVKEETSLDVDVKQCITTIKHAYSHFKITLHAYHCDYKKGTPIPHSTDELRWVKPSDLTTFPFPKANKAIVNILTQ